MFSFLMESIIVSFSVGAVVGVVVASHLLRLNKPRSPVKRRIESEAALARINLPEE